MSIRLQKPESSLTFLNNTMTSTAAAASHHGYRPHDEVAEDASFLEQMEDTPVLEELHKSHVLRIETTELLKEVQVTPGTSTWLQTAREYSLEIQSLLQSTPALQQSSSTTSPFPQLSNKKKHVEMELDSFDFVSLEPLLSIGQQHYPMGLIKPSGNAHVLPTLEYLVRTPDSVFNPKDYLGEVCFDKLNQVTWHVLQWLDRHSKTVGTIQWRYHANDVRKPCILLTPPTVERKQSRKKKKQKTETSKKKKHPKFRLQLSFGFESLDWIPAPRLFPNRCNLKHSSAESSPLYNHGLADCALGNIASSLALQHYEDKDCFPHNLQCALDLMQVWCLQRGYLRGHDTFTTSNLFVLLLYLFRTKRVGPRMTPMDVVVVALKLLAETQWNKTVLVVPHQHDDGIKYLTEKETISLCIQAQLYKEHTRQSPLSDNDPGTLTECFLLHAQGSPVVLDPTMRINYWARLSPSFLHQVQHDAKASLTCLHQSIKPSVALFLETARFWTRYDAYLRIPLDKIQMSKSGLWGNDADDAGKLESICRGLYSVLTRALGDRIHALRVLTTGNGELGNDCNDSDQIPVFSISRKSTTDQGGKTVSPLGHDTLVLGLQLNPTTAHRLVDRGPPADDTEATRTFRELWGTKAQLRRFMDGAIVHAVVWNEQYEQDDDNYVVMEGDDKTLGGTVERIIRHVLGLHFFKEKKKKEQITSSPVQFALRNMLSLVEGVASGSKDNQAFSNSLASHKNIKSAFDELSEFLRRNSSASSVSDSTQQTNRLGLPLTIDAVEPLCPSLRYTELFPPVPHPSLGGAAVQSSSNKVSGVIVSSPLLIQIRFGPSSKWPTDLNAIAAAKTAMLIQLANGIEKLKTQQRQGLGFEGTMHVTPGRLDLGFKGYSWRIVVRADPELKMLRGLIKPSPEAVSLLRSLTKDHVVSAMHHSTIHAVHTMHPSFASVIRLAKRWIASHMLSDLIPFEAIELLVTKVYTNIDAALDAPGTLVSGFMRFLKLLSSHDWARQPLIVDPQGHLTEDDYSAIFSQFEATRGSNFENGPAMYIISPNDRKGVTDEDASDLTSSTAASATRSNKSNGACTTWAPSFSQRLPEWVTLSRGAALARRSHEYLMKCLVSGEAKSDSVDWAAVFQETSASFKSYSALLRVDPDFVFDRVCSSTGSEVGFQRNKEDKGLVETTFTQSMRNRFLGPKTLRRRRYRNLNIGSNDDGLLHDWTPIQTMVGSLREKFGSEALFFYNELAPDVVALLWRPTTFATQPLSAMRSEYKRPIENDGWKSDSLVINNSQDILREMSQYTNDIIVSMKILDDRSIPRPVGVNKDEDTSSSWVAINMISNDRTVEG